MADKPIDSEPFDGPRKRPHKPHADIFHALVDCEVCPCCGYFLDLALTEYVYESPRPGLHAVIEGVLRRMRWRDFEPNDGHELARVKIKATPIVKDDLHENDVPVSRALSALAWDVDLWNAAKPIAPEIARIERMKPRPQNKFTWLSALYRLRDKAPINIKTVTEAESSRFPAQHGTRRVKGKHAQIEMGPFTTRPPKVPPIK